MSGAVVGIDLGTTNTVVAAVREAQAAALPDNDGVRLIPSVVSFHPGGNVLVGRQAKERRIVDAANTIYSIKRLIGRSWDSPEVKKARSRFPFEMREGPGQAALVVARGETYTLPEVSAFVLRKAKAVAEAAVGETVDRAVITVPANFNDLQRAATKVAGRVAGLEVLRILNEPTAAALAYGYGKGNTERIAIYDFGGGTFDITLLDLSGNVFEVLATAGNTFLGGDDIDLLIAERMADTFLAQHRYDPRTDPQSFERLRAAAEGVKMALSANESTRVTVPEIAHGGAGKPLALDFSMTRADLEQLAAPLFEATFEVVRDALSIARLSPKDFDQVLLVGGSTRIPIVRRKTEQFFGREPMEHISPDEVVAIGAAIQANALTGTERRRAAIPTPPIPAARPAGTLTQRQTRPPMKTKPPLPGKRGRTATSPGLAGRPRMDTEPGLVPPSEPTAPAPAKGAPGLGPRGHVRTDPGFSSEPRAKATTSPGLHHEFGGAATMRGGQPPVAVPPPEGMPSHPHPVTADGPGATRRRQITGMGLGTAAASAELPGTHVGLGAKGRSITGTGLGTAAAEAATRAQPLPPHTMLSAADAARAAMEADGIRPSRVDAAWEADEDETTSAGERPAPIADLYVADDESTANVPRPELPPTYDDVTATANVARPAAAPRLEDVTATANLAQPEPAPRFEDVTTTTNLAPPEPPSVVDEVTATTTPAVAPPQGLPDDATTDDLRRRYGNIPLAMPGDFKRTAPLDASEVAPERGLGATAMLDTATAEDASRGRRAPSTPDGDLDSLPIPGVPETAAAAVPPVAAASPVPAARGAGAALGGLGAFGRAAPAGGQPGQTGPLQTLAATALGMGSPLGPAPVIRDMAPPPHPAMLSAGRFGGDAPLLVDVTPLTLAVETVSGYCDGVIARNTPVPCEQTRAFVTAMDNQTSVRVRVSQGESSRFADNTLLGELELSNLRPAPRGQVEISVTFALDTDGILSVQAVDVQTGRAQNARVRLVGLPDAADIRAMASRHAAHPVL